MPRGGAREVKPEHKTRGRKPDPQKQIKIPIRLEAPIREAIAKIKEQNPRPE